MQHPRIISSVHVSHILSTCGDMQYPFVVILDSFGQASEKQCPKLIIKHTRMFQKLSLLAIHMRESDSDSAEGTDDEDEVSASSVIYSSKNS